MHLKFSILIVLLCLFCSLEGINAEVEGNTDALSEQPKVAKKASKPSRTKSGKDWGNINYDRLDAEWERGDKPEELTMKWDHDDRVAKRLARKKMQHANRESKRGGKDYGRMQGQAGRDDLFDPNDPIAMQKMLNDHRIDGDEFTANEIEHDPRAARRERRDREREERERERRERGPDKRRERERERGRDRGGKGRGGWGRMGGSGSILEMTAPTEGATMVFISLKPHQASGSEWDKESIEMLAAKWNMLVKTASSEAEFYDIGSGSILMNVKQPWHYIDNMKFVASQPEVLKLTRDNKDLYPHDILTVEELEEL